MTWRIGVDIGGTFTDVALVNEATGRIGIAKVATTPRDLTEGVIEAIRQGLARHQVDLAEVRVLAHATTIVTNALLEKKGAKAGFVTTRGFRDVLELRRSSRADLYDLFQDAPGVLVPRRWRFEVTERIDAQGEVVIPLDRPETQAAIAKHSPAGRVPVLLHDGLAIWESLAIAEYLRDIRPTAGIWPASVAARAHARVIASEMHAGFVELRTHMPMDIRASYPGKGMTPEVQTDIERITGYRPMTCGQTRAASSGAAMSRASASRFVTRLSGCLLRSESDRIAAGQRNDAMGHYRTCRSSCQVGAQKVFTAKVQPSFRPPTMCALDSESGRS